MSYKITLKVYQTNTNTYFRVAEQTVWNYANGGRWSETDGVYSLNMGGSGTSGTIRFVADNNENFLVAVGVHNYKRWCDIVTSLANDQTGVIINPEYYSPGVRAAQREKQLAEYSATSSAGRKYTVKFTVADGNNLEANIIIG